MKRIIIAGSSFAGYTAALELRELFGNFHEIIVIDKKPDFVFIPSLIWYPFGIREAEDISFDTRPIYEEHNIRFIQDTITGFDPEHKLIFTHDHEYNYDFLIIATGPKVDFESIEGLGPKKHSWSICNLEHATETRTAWENFLGDPGPIVIGASQGSSCFGAAYEFVFNLRYQLKKKNLLKKVPITFVTAEPFLAHFGIGGFANGQKMCEKMFEHYDINWRVNAEVNHVTENSVVLKTGEELASRFTMIIPRFLGIDAVRNSPGLSNENGFIPVNEDYQHIKYPEIYAAGVAVHIPPVGETPVLCGVPKTGYPSEQMAKTAAHNIMVDIYGGDHKSMPFSMIHAYCIMDTGNMGMMILGDKMTGKRHLEFIIPGPQAHWAKLAFEKYFMMTRKRGHV